MTITNRAATSAYLHALNDMQGTKPGELARIADQMAGKALDGFKWTGVKPMSQDNMMAIETAIFTSLCETNGVDWRLVNA
jgi:hypothetical protein